jgi:hypothetical protein
VDELVACEAVDAALVAKQEQEHEVAAHSAGYFVLEETGGQEAGVHASDYAQSPHPRQRVKQNIQINWSHEAVVRGEDLLTLPVQVDFLPWNTALPLVVGEVDDVSKENQRKQIPLQEVVRQVHDYVRQTRRVVRQNVLHKTHGVVRLNNRLGCVAAARINFFLLSTHLCLF